jgi:4-amino-4-deoxy-L-arabinose transferase-like glycosyltransferase
MGRLLVLITLVVLAADVWAASSLLLSFPVPWVDEAYFAAPAIDLIEQGRMGTTVLAGTLPGIETHTYWMPPVYFLAVAAVFKTLGVGLVQLRLFSVLCGLVVMLLTWLLAQESGLDRRQALVPVTLLGVDLVFLRGAFIGRMDMLTLALMLAGVLLALRAHATGSRKLLIGAMIAAALAPLTHPFGVVALPMLAATIAATNGRRSLRPLLLMLLVTALVFVPWLLYASRDWPSFVAQQSVQFQRKGARAYEGILPMITFVLEQYAGYGGFAAVLWLLGLGGLLSAAARHRKLAGLLVGAILSSALLIWSREMWYPLYAVPFTALGVGLLFFRLQESRLPARWARVPTFLLLLALSSLAYVPELLSPHSQDVSWLLAGIGLAIAGRRERFARILVIIQVALYVLAFHGYSELNPWGLAPITVVGLWLLADQLQQPAVQRLAPAAGLVLILAFGVVNAGAIAFPRLEQRDRAQEPIDYHLLVDQMDAVLPQGVTVQLCLKPDVYVDLHRRADLDLRVCPPPGLEVNPSAKELPEFHVRFLKDVEYVVVGGWSPNYHVEKWAKKYGQLVTELSEGTRSDGDDRIAVYRLPQGARVSAIQ